MEPWIGEEEIHAVTKYMESGGWLTEYKETEKFEKMFKEYIGCKYASAITNGTMSLVASLLSLNLTSSDEVIVPDFTMIASANAIKLAGGIPIFVDIDPNTLCIDTNKIEEKITENTKAIIYVSVNGRPFSLSQIKNIANEHGLVLIEDSSQSLGCYYQNKHLGTHGDLGTFSFSPAKIITTGQGGMIVTDNQDYYQIIEMLKDYGRPKSGIDYYEILGYNFKFTDLQAVIGIEQMKKLPDRIKRKKRIYKLYRDELEGIKKIEFINTDLRETTPWFIDILVDKKIRDKLISHLEKESIVARPFYPAIHTQPPYKYIKETFNNSFEVSQRGLWLPSSSFLTDDEIITICKHISVGIKSKFRTL